VRTNRFTRPLLLLLACVAFTLASAQEPAGEAAAAVPSFASLAITPAGDEAFDFSTGITTLATGGQISDRQSRITLDAAYIRYRVDDFIEAAGVVVHGPFGTIHAASLHIDIPAALLTARGELQLQGPGLTVTGQELSYFAGSGVIDLQGSVTATDPVFSAERLLHDENSGVTLLFGPYSYSDGFLTLSAEAGSAQLELEPVKDENDATTGFSASSTPEARTLELFGPYLQ
jgi:hypothetical protein